MASKRVNRRKKNIWKMFASVSIHTVALEHQHLFKFFFRFLHLRHFNSLANRYNQIKCHIRHQCYLLPNEMLFRVAQGILRIYLMLIYVNWLERWMQLLVWELVKIDNKNPLNYCKINIQSRLYSLNTQNCNVYHSKYFVEYSTSLVWWKITRKTLAKLSFM